MSIRFGRVATQINRNHKESKTVTKIKSEPPTKKEPITIIPDQLKEKDIVPSGLQQKGDIVPLKKEKIFSKSIPSFKQIDQDIKELVNTIFSKKELEILFFADERKDNLFQNQILSNLHDNEKVYIINERFDLQIDSVPKCNILFIDCFTNLNLVLREVVMKCKGLIILHIPDSLRNINFYEFKQGNLDNSFYLEGDYTLIDGRKNLCFDYPSITDSFDKVENVKIIPIKSVIQSLL